MHAASLMQEAGGGQRCRVKSFLLSLKDDLPAGKHIKGQMKGHD
jgi:hypothetical protein